MDPISPTGTGRFFIVCIAGWLAGEPKSLCNVQGPVDLEDHDPAAGSAYAVAEALREDGSADLPNEKASAGAAGENANASPIVINAKSALRRDLSTSRAVANVNSDDDASTDGASRRTPRCCRRQSPLLAPDVVDTAETTTLAAWPRPEAPRGDGVGRYFRKTRFLLVGMTRGTTTTRLLLIACVADDAAPGAMAKECAIRNMVEQTRVSAHGLLRRLQRKSNKTSKLPNMGTKCSTRDIVVVTKVSTVGAFHLAPKTRHHPLRVCVPPRWGRFSRRARTSLHSPTRSTSTKASTKLQINFAIRMRGTRNRRTTSRLQGLFKSQPPRSQPKAPPLTPRRRYFA